MEQQVFIGQPIIVGYDDRILHSKNPPCPDFFTWEQDNFRVQQVLSEWKDFSRKGLADRNMQPNHQDRARIKGSWGVGRYYFRVQTACARQFEIYYDRAPTSRENRRGGWYLLREIV